MKVTKSVTFSEPEVNAIKNKAVLAVAQELLGPCGDDREYLLDESWREITVSIKEKENKPV